MVDASTAVRASITDGWAPLAELRLVAPTLMWSEAAAGLRQLEVRTEISSAEAAAALARLVGASVEPHESRDLLLDARALAVQRGWAKTYDAEYIALARHLGARLLTIDARLARGAAGLAEVFDLS